MGLPPVPMPRALVDVGADDKVSVRALTSPEMDEIRRLVEAGDIQNSEVHIVARGTDTDVEEARDWYGSVPRSAVQTVLDKVEELIAVRTEEASKSAASGTPDG